MFMHYLAINYRNTCSSIVPLAVEYLGGKQIFAVIMAEVILDTPAVIAAVITEASAVVTDGGSGYETLVAAITDAAGERLDCAMAASNRKGASC